jgi:hypothetical protein
MRAVVRGFIWLIACAVGCTACVDQVPPAKVDQVQPVGDDVAAKITGVWRMLEEEPQREDGRTECVEFKRDGTFVASMNGKVEMQGRFRIINSKLAFIHADGNIPIGASQTINRLTADSLILTNEKTGHRSVYVRQR